MKQKPNVTFIRNIHIAPKVLFVDGISGSGKSMLGPIVSTFKSVEKYRLEHSFEYFCRLHFFGKIADDAAKTLTNLYADLMLYNSMISREVNFRPHDATGFLNDPNKFKYLARLFMPDGDVVMERIKKDTPIFQTNTHELLSAIGLAFLAFEDRLRVIEMVRHPVFMLSHWFGYGDRYGSDPRDFTLWLKDSKGQAVPWYAAGWEDEYRRMNQIDKAIRTVATVIERNNKTYDALTSKQKKQILLIPFEKFVTDPETYIKGIENLLGTKRTTATGKALIRQKVPRDVFTAGRGSKRHGWKKPDAKSSNQSEHDRIMKIVETKVTPRYALMLKKLCSDYEKRYGISF